MTEVKKHIANALAGILGESCGTAEQLSEMLEYPPDTSMGDIAFPCFKLSKALRKAPPAIAADLAAGLKPYTAEGGALCGVIGEISVAGGYLNFRTDIRYFTETLLSEILQKGDKYGSSDLGKGKKVVLDYSSPNVAKPFHIGHLGTTVIGHSLRKIHEFLGFECIGINHLGDWGTQFGKLITAYRLWGDDAKIEENGVDELVALYVRFHTEAETDPELENTARAEFRKLEDGDEENLRLWKWFISISLREYEKTYKQLGITFDSYAGESFYTDKMPAQVQKLRDCGLLKIDDGASIVDLEEYGMPPCLILKKDGTTLYPTRDIAAAYYRHETYDFDKCVYVTSSQQSLHFAQWFKVVELMGYDWFDKLVHVPYGTVSINGAKLATRTGNVVLLRDLFSLAIEKVKEIMAEKNPDIADRDDIAEAVGVGAVVYNYLSGSRIKDMNFILEDALSFDGNTGPYAQYTYARTCSLLAKEQPEDLSAPSADKIEPQELELLKVLSLFPEKVMAAYTDYEPSVITRYIFEVASAFNRFYHDCTILGADCGEVKSFRLKLTMACRYVLGSALELICMKKTEKV